MNRHEITAASKVRQAEITGKPPRFPDLDRNAEANRIVAATDRLRKSLFGDVPSLTIDQVPEIMVTLTPFSDVWERIMGLSIQVMGPSSQLSKRDQKLAILRIGWLLQAPYEFGEHVNQSRALGFSEEEIERIVLLGSVAEEWSEHERAVLRAAEELYADSYISDPTWAVLSRKFDHRQLFELIVLIGQFTLVAYFQNSLRLRLEADNEGLFAR